MTPENLATSPKTFRERDKWMRVASDMPHVAFRGASFRLMPPGKAKVVTGFRRGGRA
jgi:hypothetical protein